MTNNIEIGLGWLAGNLNRAAENGVRKIKKSIIQEHLDYSYKSINANTVVRVTLEWNHILNCFEIWEKNGWIKILNDPQTCDSNEECILLLKHLDRGPWIPGSDLP